MDMDTDVDTKTHPPGHPSVGTLYLRGEDAMSMRVSRAANDYTHGYLRSHPGSQQLQRVPGCFILCFAGPSCMIRPLDASGTQMRM